VADDAELITAYKQSGAREALDALMRRHLGRVRNVVFQMVLDDSVADDLTQEVFLRAFVGLRSFNGKSTFSTWLYRVAMNTTYSHFERRKRSLIDDTATPPEPASRPHAGPEQTAMQTELQSQVEAALAELSPKLRAAIVLTSLQQLDTAEAAEIEGCSASTMYWRVHEARKQLKARLKGHLSP
jgi:RNA polymerase sigma-70 factor (ECF subfamily)